MRDPRVKLSNVWPVGHAELPWGAIFLTAIASEFSRGSGVIDGSHCRPGSTSTEGAEYP